MVPSIPSLQYVDFFTCKNKATLKASTHHFLFYLPYRLWTLESWNPINRILVYVIMHIYTCTHIYIHAHTNTHRDICVHTLAYTHAHMCMHIQIYKRTHIPQAYTHAHVYIYICTCKWACICAHREINAHIHTWRTSLASVLSISPIILNKDTYIQFLKWACLSKLIFKICCI